MSTGLELCAKVSDSNKINQNLRGIRMKDGWAFATNMINTIKTKNEYLSADCLVEADEYLKTLKATKNAKQTFDGRIINIEEDKFKAKIATMGINDYNEDIEREPKGTEIKPDGFMAALKRIFPFLKLANNDLWIINGFLYAVSNQFIVRTPADCELHLHNKAGDPPLTLHKDTAELMLAVMEKPTKIVFSDDAIAVVFENTWIEGNRNNPNSLVDFEEILKPIENVTFTPFPETVQAQLKRLADFAGDQDTITFGPFGISVLKNGRAQWTINHPMPDMLFGAKGLKALLSLKEVEFNFDDPWKLYFSNKELEGLWTAIRSLSDPVEQPTDEEVEDAMEEELDEEYEHA